MIGSGDPTPYDLPALGALCVLAAVLLAGCVFGPSLPVTWALLLRWGCLLVSLCIVAAVYIFSPSASGIVGAGRLLTLWPAQAVIVILFGVWTWRHA